MSSANFTITSANVTRVISIATAIYWALAGWVLWSDLRSGEWLQKGGAWIGLVLLTGLCGAGFWVMLAPVAIHVFKANWRPFTLKKVASGFWYLSTIPVVLLCLWFVLLLVYYRLSELCGLGLCHSYSTAQQNFLNTARCVASGPGSWLR